MLTGAEEPPFNLGHLPPTGILAVDVRCHSSTAVGCIRQTIISAPLSRWLLLGLGLSLVPSGAMSSHSEIFKEVTSGFTLKYCLNLNSAYREKLKAIVEYRAWISAQNPQKK